MQNFNQQESDKICQIIKQNILVIPGVASKHKNEDDNLNIYIIKNSFGLTVNININCFSYVNIWAVMHQVQNQVKYVIDRIIKHKENVEINVNVSDLIEEDII